MLQYFYPKSLYQILIISFYVAKIFCIFFLSCFKAEALSFERKKERTIYITIIRKTIIY